MYISTIGRRTFIGFISLMLINVMRLLLLLLILLFVVVVVKANGYDSLFSIYNNLLYFHLVCFLLFCSFIYLLLFC